MSLRQERLQAKGALAELRSRCTSLEIEAKGLILLLRLALNPYESDITQLPLQEAAANMQRLVELHKSLQDLQPRITKLEHDLE